jgi:hypothetical protein
LRTSFCLPIADKLQVKLHDEETNRTLIIDGVLMIRESKSPAVVREMLVAYLPERHHTRHRKPCPPDKGGQRRRVWQSNADMGVMQAVTAGS